MGEIYNPALYWAASHVLGEDLSFKNLRLVTVLPLITTILLCAILLRGRIFSGSLGTLWILISLLGYQVFCWIDLARVDSIVLSLILLAILTTSLNDRRLIYLYVLTGLFLATAAAVKQSAVLFLLAPLLLLPSDRRQWISLLTALLMGGLYLLLFRANFGPNYVLWTIDYPSMHAFGPARATRNVVTYMILQWIWVVVPAFCLARGVIAMRSGATRLSTATAYTTAAFAGTLLSVGKDGGSVQNFALYSVQAGLVLARFLESQIAARNYLMIGLLLLGLTMPAILRPLHDASPSAYRPAPEDAARFQALVTFVADQPGAIWIPSHPAVGALAGKEVFTPLQTLLADATLEAPHLLFPVELRPAIQAAIDMTTFAIVITPSEISTPGNAIEDALNRRYQDCGLLPDRMTLRFYVSRMFVPDRVWTPKEAECPVFQQR